MSVVLITKASIEYAFGELIDRWDNESGPVSRAQVEPWDQARVHAQRFMLLVWWQKRTRRSAGIKELDRYQRTMPMKTKDDSCCIVPNPTPVMTTHEHHWYRGYPIPVQAGLYQPLS